MAAITGLGLGRIFDLVHEASGVPINLKHAEAVTFLSFVATGDQVLTVEEATDGAGQTALAVIDRVHKSPGVGGSWTEVTQTAASSFTNADATNDQVAVTVTAASLSDGNNQVECTVTGGAGGTCIAILHDLNMRRKPANLPSNV